MKRDFFQIFIKSPGSGIQYNVNSVKPGLSMLFHKLTGGSICTDGECLMRVFSKVFSLRDLQKSFNSSTSDVKLEIFIFS